MNTKDEIIKYFNDLEEVKRIKELEPYIKNNEEINNKFNELKRFECHSGDIIMSCSGTIGKLYQLPVGIDKGIINQALLKFTVNEDEVLSQYFIDYMRMHIDSLETKGSGLQNLGSVSYIKNMSIPVPDIKLQKKYLNIVNHIDKQKFVVMKSASNVSKIRYLC